MRNLRINGVVANNVKCNNVQVQTVRCNNVVVWENKLPFYECVSNSATGYGVDVYYTNIVDAYITQITVTGNHNTNVQGSHHQNVLYITLSDGTEFLYVQKSVWPTATQTGGTYTAPNGVRYQITINSNYSFTLTFLTSNVGCTSIRANHGSAVGNWQDRTVTLCVSGSR